MVEEVAEPMSKDMNGMPDPEGRGGWNGAVGTRRCWTLPLEGVPPEGKTTGGTVNCFDMARPSEDLSMTQLEKD